METTAHKHLAVFLPALWGGGAERTMLNLAHGFNRRGHRVDLVLAQRAGPYLKEVSDDLNLVDLSAEKNISKHHTLRSVPALVRYLKNERPDAMLASMVPANIVAVTARRLAGYSNRVVINEQNTLSQNARNARKRLLRWGPKFAKTLYPWADSVVGVSQGVADDLVQSIGVPREKVRVIHNPGVTPELADKAKAALHHPWFEAGQPPVILGVGSLTEQKDFANLVQAFSQVRKQRQARLVILGEGRLRAPLEKQIQSLGLTDDVAMPGFVDNPYAYMSRASVFVLSSRWEGLPTVLVEAMYCGVPLVATDCPSGPREILKGGQLGHLVAMQNPADIASSIINIFNGKTPVVAPENWQRYELETIIDQYLESLVG